MSNNNSITRQAARLVDSKAVWMGRRYNLQQADLDDVRQVGYLAVLEHLPAWDEQVTLSAYLSSYVTYAMLDYCEDINSGGITGRRSGDAKFLPLDTPVDSEPPINDMDGEPESILLADVLADDAAMPDKALMIARLHIALNKLPVRLSNLLSLYYGLTDTPPLTLRQIAAKRRVPLVRVYRQLLEAEKALRSMI